MNNDPKEKVNDDKNVRPKAGDGTLQEERTETQANWYGASQRPQEEFINEHAANRGTDPDTASKEKAAQTSESVPQAPEEIFPFGDPGSQSDG